METVAFDDLEPTVLGDDTCRYGLSDPLGTTDLAINRYRIAPGEGFPGGLHAHVDQEEVFVVLDGEATFETMNGDVTVTAGETVRFAPGEFQAGRNDGDAPLVALALGAPRDSEDVRLPVECPDCGHGDVRLSTGGDGVTFVCPACDAEHVPRPCPACDGEDLQVTLGERSSSGEEARTVVVCRDCGATYETPPLRD